MDEKPTNRGNVELTPGGKQLRDTYAKTVMPGGKHLREMFRGTGLAEIVDGKPLLNNFNVVDEPVPDIRAQHKNLAMPNQSGAEAFFCKSKECIEESDKMKNMAGIPGMRDEVIDLIREEANAICSEMAKYENVFLDRKKKVEALMTLMGYSEIEWRKKKECSDYSNYVMYDCYAELPDLPTSISKNKVSGSKPFSRMI